MDTAITIGWVLAGFFAGALPFSVWIGRLAMGKDIRLFGDGNPGAFNVFRAGGRGWGWLAILLDGLKGAIPVGLANFWAGYEGWSLACIALAPVLGHAFSPFLRLRGGKGLAVTFGVWTGLSLWLAPTILGGLFAVFLWIFRRDVWAVFLGQAGLGLAFAWLSVDRTWFVVWAGSTAILIVKYFPLKLSSFNR